MSSADDCSIPSIGIDAWYDEAYPPMTTLSATAPCLLSPIRHPGDCLYVPSSPTSVDDGVSSTVPPSSTLATHSSVNFQPTGLVLRDTSRSPPTLTPPNSDRHAQDYVNDLLATWERRRPLLSMLMVDSNRQEQFSKFRKELGKIEAQIGTNLTLILQSQDARREARQLTGSNGQVLIDAIQDVLSRGTLPDAASRSQAWQLLQKVIEAQEQFPSSLFITGVNDHDEYPTFHGGFSDVYRASYQGQMVALKRLRTFTADSTAKHTRLQFYKEALVWQDLRHPFILPLLGIDRVTFAPSFWMVSPWMKYGTVLKYLRDHGQGDVNRLLLEIAQGLDYLHSMNVVHGDLRGTNILISDDGNASVFALRAKALRRY